MKKVSVLVAAAVVSGMFFTSCGPKTNVSLKSDVDSVSYAIGVSTGLGYKENLKYQVITEGTGAKPTAEDHVKVHYTGTLLDGTKFDSSIDRGEPAEFPVSQVIKGWTEGLQLMPVGSKYIFWIPSDLAYGDRGAGQMIKPNSTLKFEVELLEIVNNDKK